MNNVSQYLTSCCTCGRRTSKAYARKHNGACKACATQAMGSEHDDGETRNARILDSGWSAYAMEEGHYDEGGDS